MKISRSGWLIIFLIPTILFAQPIDSLKITLSKTTDMVKSVKLMNEIGYAYARVNRDSSRFYLQKSLKTLSLQSNFDLEVQALNYLGMNHAMQGKLDSAKLYFQMALDVCLKNEMDSALAMTNYGMGNLLNIAGEQSASLAAYLDALKYFEKNGQESLALSTKANMSYVYRSIGELNKSLELIKETNNYYEKVGNASKLINSYSRMGSIYQELAEYDSAMQYNEKALVLAEKENDGYAISKLEHNLGNNLLMMKEYQKALIQFQKSLHHSNKDRSDEGDVLDTYVGMMLASARLSDMKKANEFAAKAASMIDQIEAFEPRLYYYESSFTVDSLASNYLGAVRNLQKFNQLQSIFLNEKKTKQIAELQTQYETEKKDQEIATLSQQAQIQELQISQRNTQLIGAGIALLVLVLGGFAFNQQRKFKHQQAVSDMEQRMLRLQMNPHFIFNALASIQNYILQSDTKESVSYLAKFGKLMRQILEHSREEFITIEEETDMLRNYLEIQQLRFKNRFDFKIEVDAAINSKEMQIPPLFAQPFVENAIEHGLKDKISDGLITIRFSPEGKNIRLEVEDNGSGIQDSGQSQKAHKSLATVISRERLTILGKRFSANYTMNVQNAHSGSGTLTVLILPAI